MPKCERAFTNSLAGAFNVKGIIDTPILVQRQKNRVTGFCGKYIFSFIISKYI